MCLTYLGEASSAWQWVRQYQSFRFPGCPICLLKAKQHAQISYRGAQLLSDAHVDATHTFAKRSCCIRSTSPIFKKSLFGEMTFTSLSIEGSNSSSLFSSRVSPLACMLCIALKRSLFTMLGPTRLRSAGSMYLAAATEKYCQEELTSTPATIL